VLGSRCLTLRVELGVHLLLDPVVATLFVVYVILPEWQPYLNIQRGGPMAKALRVERVNVTISKEE
jgi:hypothetical protein